MGRGFLKDTMKILLVDDDQQFSDQLKASLTACYYTVDTAIDGQEGWNLVETFDYDLILLDILLPKLDGISFCRRLRAKGSQTLVLLLTARSTSHDKILGLDAGADDYVVKPIGFQELEARIRALLRRKTTATAPRLEWGNLRLDSKSGEVTYNHASLSLTRKEYGLLELFLRNPDRIFSHSAILTQLWSFESDIPGEETVRAHIKRLRQKLKGLGASDLIETVYGLGYRLNSDSHKNPTASESQPKSSQNTRPIVKPDLAVSQPLAVNDWETTKRNLIERTAILEQATRSLSQNLLTDDVRQRAQQECHKLIGSLGLLGLPAGSELVQQIQPQLQRQLLLKPKQLQWLCEQVATLQNLIKNAADPKDSNVNQHELETQPRSLLISDDQEFGSLLVAEATTRGLHLLVMANMQLAKDAIQRVCPDVLLLDLSTPERYRAGLLLLEGLSQETPSLPVIVLMDSAQVTDRLTIARHNGRGIFPKSIAPARILEVLAQTLEPPKNSEAKILIVDDDPIFLRLLKAILKPWGLQVTTLKNPLEFWDELQSIRPDLLILDVQMPDVDGIELCRMLRNDSDWAWLPVLFLTGHKDTDTIQQLFAAGADDYISKPVVPPEIITRILNRLERTRLLRNQAEVDGLTRLSNRSRATQDIINFLHLSKQYQQPFCLAVLELDNLKQVNHQYDHRLGDQILYQTARLLRQAFRSQDVVSRWDGAEFVIGMYGITRRDGVEWLSEVLESLRQVEFLSSDGGVTQASFSVGVSQYPEDGTGLQTLYQTTRVALEQAKGVGGDRVLPVTWQSSPTQLDVILLHQDTPFAQSLLKALTTRGYHSHWLQGGMAVDAILKDGQNSLFSQSRAILIEANLPGLSGLELIKRLRKRNINQRSRLILLSTQPSEAEAAMNLGCFDYVNLPCSLTTLIAHLRRAIEA